MIFQVHHTGIFYPTSEGSPCGCRCFSRALDLTLQTSLGVQR